MSPTDVLVNPFLPDESAVDHEVADYIPMRLEFSPIGLIILGPLAGVAIAVFLDWPPSAVAVILVLAGAAAGYAALVHGRAERGLRRAAEVAREAESILHSIGMGAPLGEVLDGLTRWMESQSPGARAAIGLFDAEANCLRQGASPSLPQAYAEVLKEFPIGPDEAGCGRAVWRREPVSVDDVSRDPSWVKYREVAASCGIAAAYTVPILNPANDPVGTVALYRAQPGTIRDADRQVAGRAAAIALLAIERDQAAREIERVSGRYRALVENTSDIVSILGADGIVRYVSPTCERVLGYRPAEFLNRSFLHGVHPDDLAGSGAAFERDRSTPGIAEVRICRVRHAHGGFRHLELLFNNLLNHPAVSGIVCNARDITPRRHAELALVESEQRYRELFENAHDLLLTTDLTGNLTSVNRACERRLDRPRAALLRGSLESICAQPRGAATWIAEHLGGVSTLTAETELISAHGERIPVEMTSRLVFAAGVPVGLHITVRDLGERRLLEAELHRAQKMEGLGLLAGSVAHDFNNILTVISGYTRWIADAAPAGSATAENAAEVLMAADRAALLVRQLLALSRPGSAEPTPSSVAELAASLNRMMPPLLGQRVEFEVRVAEPTSTMVIDAARIEVALLNLLLNARDAMPEGGRVRVTVATVELDAASVRLYRPARAGTFVEIAVHDTGHGMDEATLGRVFEPFFSTKPKGRGTGLGLPTALSLVRQSGGFIRARSEPGVGSTFTVLFPAWSGPQTTGMSPNGDGEMTGSELILIVEDEDGVRKLVRDMLQRLGYRLLEAADGVAAEVVFRDSQDTIDLVLSDVVMPSRGGVDLAERLRAIKPEVKVLFMSGYADDAVTHHRMLQSGRSFLQKPFTPESLARQVRSVLDTSPAGEINHS